MVTEIRAAVLGFTLLAVPACHAQVRWDISPRTSETLHQSAHLLAVRDVAQGFNRIGSHAVDLRRAMTREDAEAFDAVMLDVMSSLIALPYFGLRDRDSGDPVLLRPTRPRYDRIPQIGRDLQALDRFFVRLQLTAQSTADARLFARAGKDVRRMLAALPEALPVISVKDAQTGARK